MNTYQKNMRIKTICTVDTNDIDLNDAKHQPIVIKHKKSANQHYINKFKTPKNSTSNNQVLHKTKRVSISQNKKHKRLLTQPCYSLQKKILHRYHQQDNLASYKILVSLKDDKQQQIYIAQNQLTKKKSLIRKTKNNSLKKKYQHEIKINQQLKKLTKNKKKTFCIITHVQKLTRQIALVYDYYGSCLNWSNPSHLQLMRKSIKNNGAILKFIVIQLAKAIDVTSQLGIVHSGIKINNFYIQLEQQDTILKMQKIVKIGNFFKSFNLEKQKSQLLNLDQDLYTPPQILNYMMFDKKYCQFNRQMLNQLQNYQDPSKIDIWALGIVILTILKCQPLNNNQVLSLSQLFKISINISNNYGSLISLLDFDETFSKLVTRMLDSNPSNRPHPKQIIFNL